jgi:UDP-N-acetylglucosamine 2-epimerase (hydrolysing)
VTPESTPKKILFITGTRADFGKLKPLISAVQNSQTLSAKIFVTGMHLLEQYGGTWREVEKSGLAEYVTYNNQTTNRTMDGALAQTILGLSSEISSNRPDLIVVHGDRVEALAAALVGVLNRILVAHIEGGEISGTVDESIRHAITKLAHTHFVSNSDAVKRILQLGENPNSIHEIGSPEVDVMVSSDLPDLPTVLAHYGLPFNCYAIAILHPVTTELNENSEHARTFVDALIESERDYIVLLPNNDDGTLEIQQQLNRLSENEHFQLFPSMRFEFFLTALKHAEFIIGNSSSGVREAPFYGTPSINIGSRQAGRIQGKQTINCVFDKSSILRAIEEVSQMDRSPDPQYGHGGSADKFRDVLESEDFWTVNIQKTFLDGSSASNLVK